MPDTVTLPGTGSVIASDDIGGVQYQRVKLVLGGDGVNEGDVSSAAPIPTGGVVAIVSGTVSRPADTTPYAVGDAVGSSAVTLNVARSVSGSFGSVMIRRARLRKTGTSIANAYFRLHFYDGDGGALTVASDNAAYSTNGVQLYLGSMDVIMDQVFTDGAAGFAVPNVGGEIVLRPTSTGQVRVLLEARAAYTPVSSETFGLTLDVWQN